MEFKFNNFIVFTKKESEQLDDRIAVPTKLKNGKPSEYSFQYKIKEFTIFNDLYLIEKKDGKYYRVINDLFNFIDFIEILKAFSGNKLDTEKEYKLGKSFTAKTAQKNGKMSLRVHFTNYSYDLFLDKFECSSLASKFQKILSRCEAWQEQDQ
jgi:hypothetical protein